MARTRVIQYGLGPIGCAAARLIEEREHLELVGAVDVDPTKVGRDVGGVIGLDRRLGLDVRRKLAETEVDADVVVHTTSSHFDLFLPQVLEILDAGLDIVSTSEELSFPWRDHATGAAAIDEAAQRAGKTVLGTGVNPGFLMDALPLFLTSIVQRVDHVDVTRVINASTRRGPFQAKIGAGLTREEFEARMGQGRMGHVGLPESMAMIFDTLGKELVAFESSVEPLVAESAITTEFVAVQPGQVRGLRQTGRGCTAEGELASLTFRAGLDEEPDGDTVSIRGLPDLVVKLQGTNGDLATVAIVVNAIDRVLRAAPGLVTMRDLPIVTLSG